MIKNFKKIKKGCSKELVLIKKYNKNLKKAGDEVLAKVFTVIMLVGVMIEVAKGYGMVNKNYSFKAIPTRHDKPRKPHW